MGFARKNLVHRPPDWVNDGDVFFITICLQNRDSDTLIQSDVSASIFKSVAYYQQAGHWWVELFLLMPNHLHALISFNQKDRSMSTTIQLWKRYLNRECGIEWQRGYFDHRLRSKDAHREKALYIRQNPVRAGLVERASDWKHVWTATELSR